MPHPRLKRPSARTCVSLGALMRDADCWLPCGMSSSAASCLPHGSLECSGDLCVEQAMSREGDDRPHDDGARWTEQLFDKVDGGRCLFAELALSNHELRTPVLD